MNETRGLWDTTHADKRIGRIFQSTGSTNSTDFELTMAQAVKKHGRVELPSSHIEEFYDRINQEKKNIV